MYIFMFHDISFFASVTKNTYSSIQKKKKLFSTQFKAIFRTCTSNFQLI